MTKHSSGESGECLYCEKVGSNPELVVSLVAQAHFSRQKKVVLLSQDVVMVWDGSHQKAEELRCFTFQVVLFND